jgi:cation:H+ antiporter
VLTWLQVVVGLLLLVGSAELLVRGASALASRFGISSLAIGLTVVAYGTSAPELAVSLAAAWRESPGIVVGNVVGSNVANLGLVIGISALIRPLSAHIGLLRQEVPFLLVAAVLVPVAALGGGYGRIEGFILLAGALGFSIFCFVRAMRESLPPGVVPLPEGDAPLKRPLSLPTMFVLILAGIGGLGLGSTVLVDGAVSIATSLGVSDHVIGLTLVALGTSLPELATCVVSAIHEEVDLVVGNVIGSNVFNVFFILGGTAAIHPIPAPPALLGLDVVVMLALSFALVPFILTGARISRVEGAIYLAAYAGFTYFVLFQG